MKPFTFKRIISLCVLLTAFVFNGQAQTLKDVFSSSDAKLFYLGIDFTKAKLIDDATANETDIRDRQFAGINDVVINEPKKYDLKGALHKSDIDHDLSLVQKRNSKVNADQIKSTSSADFDRLKESDIDNLVKGFDFGGKSGVGLLFVVEGMSKTAKAANVWVTFVDMKAKKVLYTERMEGKAGGFGFRNYWAQSIKNVIDAIEKKKYKEWKGKFAA